MSTEPKAPLIADARTLRRPLNLREASYEDYAQIAALESKYGLEAKVFDEWKHLWFNNPAYKEHQGSMPIGWVLEAANQKIVGYLGNIPLHYEVEGRRLLASVAHAWVVETDYRPYSVLLLERYFSQKIVDLFLNATVGPRAADAFAAFQSVPVPVGDWDRSLFWITNYQHFLMGWLAMKAFPLAKPLSYLLSFGIFLKDAFTQRRLGPQNEVELERCTEVDARFDIFWEALRKINSHRLMAVRSREVLEWHFKYALLQNKAWIVTATKGSDLAAYAIFHRHDNLRYGLRRIRLVDYQTLDGNTAYLGSMLSWALERCKGEGVDMLESIGFCAHKRNVIEQFAPHQRRLPSWLYFYKTGDQHLAEKLNEPGVWDPSQYDGDASF